MCCLPPRKAVVVEVSERAVFVVWVAKVEADVLGRVSLADFRISSNGSTSSSSSSSSKILLDDDGSAWKWNSCVASVENFKTLTLRSIGGTGCCSAVSSIIARCRGERGAL